MKRNMFNEPRPENQAEMSMALAERDADPANCNAQIEHADDDGFGGIGWTAEVMDNFSGEVIFSTLAFESLKVLQSQLTDAGITNQQTI